MSKSIVIVVGIVMAACLPGCGKSGNTPDTKNLDYIEIKAFKNQNELKSQYPDAYWLNYDLDDTKFLFCTNHLPSDGDLIIEFQVWVFNSHLQQWKQAMSVKTNGVGKFAFSVDSKTQILSATGDAGNIYQGKSLFTINLKTFEQGTPPRNWQRNVEIE